MKRTSRLLMGLSFFAFTLVVSMPCCVHAHGGIGGFHSAGVHTGTGHVGGINAVGFHAGGVHVGGVGDHVGYYPHYNAGVGYYHPVARTAAWSAAYNNTYGDWGGAYGGYNPNPYQQGSPPSIPGPGGGPEFGESPEANQAEKQLDAALNEDKDN
jgi:hypothetical protein